MKKAILILAIVLVALVGLTSYNSNEVKKEKGNGNLIAELTTGGIVGGTTVGNGGNGGKKLD